MYKKLVEVRKANNVAQKDLAKAIGLKPELYNKKEKGTIRMFLSEAMNIARYFNMTVDELFGEDL